MKKTVKTRVPRSLGKNPTPLRKFILQEIARLGVNAVQEIFGVTEGSLYHWARGASLPRFHHMQMIVELSKGKVSYASMIEPYNKTQSKKKV